MDNQQNKLSVIEFLLLERNFIACFTETINGADVFGINRSYYTTEVEVKSRREDLLNELHTINAVMGVATSNLRQRATKFQKHATYLGTKDAVPELPIPNQFYIAFPKEIMDHRLHGLDLRYGILTIDEGKVTVVREAQKLHTQKIDIEYAWKLVRKASYENYILRKKITEGGEEINEIPIPNS